ncbi:hypothetical protein YN18_003876 [Salmonella enterica subsp. enterica]|nr:hypothetical protein [Salmonella enterica subsp. enterica]EDR6143305.1 hypothetical protein [Salmonella enterica subsp. enterica]EDU9862678.1 hypothetical protein [Salmonella enterica subsp. enterica]EDV0533463.1 hypothetical protein [Salmonella enterica subsp. enterica]EDW2740823.1 hypothetical protein [Salmonella enterica subsp. enterica]
MTRIENTEQLKAYMNTLFETTPCAIPVENYGFSFIFNDSPKKIRAQLQKKLNNHEWDGYGYRDEEMNIVVLLHSQGG